MPIRIKKKSDRSSIIKNNPLTVTITRFDKDYNTILDFMDALKICAVDEVVYFRIIPARYKPEIERVIDSMLVDK